MKNTITPSVTRQIVAGLLGAMALLPGFVSAVEFVVDTQTDAIDINLADGHCITAANQCSLRAAIQQTNALPGRDTIRLPAGTYTLTITGSNEDAGASGDLDVNDGLSIIGAGSSQSIIDAAQLDRVLDIRGAHFLTLQGMSLTNGRIEGGLGGGIVILGSVGNTQVDQLALLKDITISNNIANNGIGGGLYNSSNQPISIEDSTINNNQAKSGGGISSSQHLSILRTTIANNITTESSAGISLLNGGYLFNNTIENNESGKSAAGVDAGDHVVIQGGIVKNNRSGAGGGIGFAGGIKLNDLSVTGDSTGYFYLGDINIDANSATRNGGGVYANFSPSTPKKVILVRLNVQNNRADIDGGGLFLNHADLISNSQFNTNQSANNGGAIKLTKPASSSAVTTIARSAFIGNSVINNGSGVLPNACGGALSATDGNYSIENSTFSGNSVETSAVSGTSRGGALCVLNSANNTFLLSQSTIVDNLNSATSQSGNVFLTVEGSATLFGNIIHSPGSGVNCNVSNKVTSGGSNLGYDNTCNLSHATDVITTDAVTQPLADNGGGTQTHALTPNSPALNNVPQSQCRTLDQRGYTRSGENCDAGAHEQNSLPITTGDIIFSANEYSANESDGNIQIVLQRINGNEGKLSVELVSWPETADIDRSNTSNPVLDFDDTPHTVTWNPNDSADKVVTLTITDDNEYEGNETFITRILPLDGQDQGITDGAPIQASVTINDNDPAPIPEFNFSTSSIDVSENQAGLFLTVERNITRVTDAADIHYEITGGSAQSNGDYLLSDGSVHFAPGEFQKGLVIQLVDDNEVEALENIQISLVAKTSDVALAGSKPTSVNVNILDNDEPAQPKPTNISISLNSENVTEDTANVTLTLNRSGVTDNITTVEFLLGTSTATLDSDFSLTPALSNGIGTVQFAVGETRQTILLTLVNDQLPEQNETINILLRTSDPDVGIGADGSVTITIIDDDIAATDDGIFNFEQSAISQNEATPSFSIKINRSGNTTSPQTIMLSLKTSGTAENGSDYNYQNIPIEFSQNTVSRLFSISVVDDAIIEADETIILSMTGVSGNGIIGSTSETTLTINDNDTPTQSPDKNTGGGSGSFGLYLIVWLLLALRRNVKLRALLHNVKLNTVKQPKPNN